MSLTQIEHRPYAIDRDALLERCLGNLQFAERILSVFEARGASDLAELELAIRERDLPRVAAVSHRFKGACSNTAAIELSQCVARLGQAALAGDVAAVTEQYREVTKNWTVFLAALVELKWDPDDAEPAGTCPG